MFFTQWANEIAKETQMCRTVFWTLGEEGGDDLGEWH